MESWSHGATTVSRASGVSFFSFFQSHLGGALIGATIMLICLTSPVQSAGLPFESMLISKRLAQGISGTDLALADDFDDSVRYDEYPVVVPKRAAIIIDRILKEIESAKEDNRVVNDWSSPMSRRGNNKDKLYFRCYFNAVSCYKKK